MSPFDHKQVLSDYANGKMTVEIAMGHTLQHIDNLYELQTTANINRYELRGKVDTLESRVNTLQTEVARLTALIEKFVSRRRQTSSGASQSNRP